MYLTYLCLHRENQSVRYISFITVTSQLSFNFSYSINGRRNRTLHLYVVTATNLSFRPRANAETSYSVRYDLVVVVMSIMGGGEKFSHGMMRS
jgi:hypothetical protein